MSSWWLRPPADDGDESEKKLERPATSVGEIAGRPSENEAGDKRGRRRRSRSRVTSQEADDLPMAAADESQRRTAGAVKKQPQKEDKVSEAKPARKAARKRPEKKDRQKEDPKNRDSESRDSEADHLRWREGEEAAQRFHQILRESEVPVGSQVPVASPERRLALFCDLENLALGVRDSQVKAFDIHLVLERLLEKGRIIVKKAYCDWERYSEYKRPFHEAAIEMIGIPHRRFSGKNSADIKMVVDAMDLSYSKEHLDTFVILSGDSDFSPLVSKLRENNKFVIGVGVKNSTSPLLIDNCDEFIYYEDVWRDQQKTPQLDGLDDKQGEVFSLMIDAIVALLRENREVLWGSMIKQTMQRKRPSFSESYFGYSSFSEVLEDAETKGLIKLRRDPRSGSYVVTGFAGR